MSVSRPTLIPPALYCALALDAASRTQRAAALRIVVIVSSSRLETAVSNAQVVQKLPIARAHLRRREHLLFAAGQLGSAVLAARGERGKRVGALLRGPATRVPDGRQLEVLAHRQRGEDGALLRNVSGSAPGDLVAVEPRDVLTTELDR